MPAAGALVRASDVDRPQARKTATESVTSSATLQNDDELFVSVEANAIYTVVACLFYDGATAGDFKFSFTGPSGYSFDYAATIAPTAATTAAGNTVNNSAFAETDTLGVGAVGAGTTLVVPIQGILVISSTAGTFQLQWAQNASSATATRVFAPSFLDLFKWP
jgi:hypothetical protein